MDAEDLVIDDDGEGQVIEHVGEVVPDVCVAVFAIAFCIEAVRLGDASRFVVTTDEVHTVGIAELETHEEGDGFDGEETTIYVVAWLGGG